LKKQNIVVGLRWWCEWLHNVEHIDWSFTFGKCTKEWIGTISSTLLHLNNGQAEGMRTNPDSLTASEATRKLWEMPNTTLNRISD
jgi:hypothetical protein